MILQNQFLTMIRIAKYNGEIIEAGRRIIKSFVKSKKDVHTSFQSACWGDDSTPIAGADVIHAQTATDDTVILGVINVSQKTTAGEKRIFATDTSGAVVFDIWLRADGTVEIGGDSDFAVKYIPLDSALQSFAGLINAELVKIAAAITPAGAYVPTPVSVNISGSKNAKIKTI